MAVKHKPTKEVYKGVKGGKTACGFNTRDNPSHWMTSREKITCAKNGCKS